MGEPSLKVVLTAGLSLLICNMVPRGGRRDSPGQVWLLSLLVPFTSPQCTRGVCVHIYTAYLGS